MRRIAACLLLGVLSTTLTVPTFARTSRDNNHAARKSAKIHQKKWNKFVKRQRKADRKAAKRKRLDKRSEERRG